VVVLPGFYPWVAALGRGSLHGGGHGYSGKGAAEVRRGLGAATLSRAAGLGTELCVAGARG
jgi:hypothetical protein